MSYSNHNDFPYFIQELAEFIEADKCAWHAGVKRKQMPDDLYRDMMIYRHYNVVVRLLACLFESH